MKKTLSLLNKILFILETKPLMWERLKLTERFNFVHSGKIVHVVEW